MFTVCGSATGEWLADLPDVKDALGLDDSQYDQTLLRMVRRASSRIESYLGRSLQTQVYQAVLPGYGRRKLVLPAYPVRSLFRVFDGTDTGTGTELTATAGDFRLDAARGVLERDDGWPWTFQMREAISPFPEPGQEYPRFLVEFSAGYVPPLGKCSTFDGTTTTGMTLEQDLQDATIALVRNMWHDRSRPTNVRSKSVGEISISYGESKGELPDEVLAILAPYRSNL